MENHQYKTMQDNSCWLLHNFYHSLLHSDENTELTDLMLSHLSRKITSRSDLRLIGLTLGVDSKTIDRHILNELFEINEAAYKVLSNWCESCENRKDAHGKIKTALRKVNMAMYIDEILEKQTE